MRCSLGRGPGASRLGATPGLCAWVPHLVRGARQSSCWSEERRGREEERKKRKKEEKKRREERGPGKKENRERGRETFSSARVFQGSKPDYIAFQVFRFNSRNLRFTLYEIFGYHSKTHHCLYGLVCYVCNFMFLLLIFAFFLGELLGISHLLWRLQWMNSLKR